MLRLGAVIAMSSSSMRNAGSIIAALFFLAVAAGIVGVVAWVAVSALRHRRAWRPSADDRRSTGPAPAGEPNPHARPPSSGATAGMAGAFHQQAHNGHGDNGPFGSPGGGLPQHDPYRQGR
jgi:hypothetical protein